MPVLGSSTGVEVEPRYGREVRAADRPGLERLAEAALPHDGARGGVDPVGVRLLGGHDGRAPDDQRLGVDGPLQLGGEDLGEGPGLDGGGRQRGSDGSQLVRRLEYPAVVTSGGPLASASTIGTVTPATTTRTATTPTAARRRRIPLLPPACLGKTVATAGSGFNVRCVAASRPTGRPRRAPALRAYLWLATAARCNSVKV